jgi:hypothetical protein
VSENLVQLAEQFLRLSGELDATREAMKRVLMNGAEAGPFAATPARRPGANRSKAREAEVEIVELLKGRPGLRTSEIAQATGSVVVTTQDRLRRLKERGEVQAVGGGAWAASV